MGHRVVAIDGSTIIYLSNLPLLCILGHSKAQTNQFVPQSEFRWPMMSATILILDASINKVATSEVDMARGHLSSLNPSGDLLLFNRSYPRLGNTYDIVRDNRHFYRKSSSASNRKPLNYKGGLLMLTTLNLIQSDSLLSTCGLFQWYIFAL